MKDIICFSSTRWDFLWQRPQQVMSRLSGNNKVLFVDHFILTGGKYTPGFSGQTHLRQINSNLFVLSIRYASKRQFVRIIGDVCQSLDIHRPVIWVYYPTVVSVLDEFDYSLLCYDCVDDFRSFSWTPGSFAFNEEKLIQKSDLVFVTAKRLKKLKERENSEIYLVPNGADERHFNKALDKSLPVHDEIKVLKKPVIGFIGAIYEWVDLALVQNMCRERPEWSFVLVGPVSKDVPNASRPRNLYFMGRKDYGILPRIIKGFDVCIIPFKVNSLTECTNPIKLYEYLAAGKPVVSTPIPEVTGYNEVVKTASTAGEFIKAVEESIKQEKVDLVKKRLEIAGENSWDSRVMIMERLIDEKLKKQIKP